MKHYLLLLPLSLSLAACSNTTVVEHSDGRIYDYGHTTIQAPTIEHVLEFEFDSADLTNHHKDQLKTHINHLILNPWLSIRIQGRANQAGSFEYNHDLATQRAERIRVYMLDEGVEPNQILISSISELAEQQEPNKSVVLSY
ncbi:hypothetical protein C9975_04625 [Thalassospira xiamenensis]|nr:hypothetical protein C9975_04625 [Thalassospira xiamenensis]